MTVITYRSGIIACDSCWNDASGMIDNLQTKIQRLPSGALYGAAGDVDDRRLVELLKDVKHSCELPASTVLREFSENINALIILPSWKVFYVDTGEEDGAICPVQGDYAAVGIGRLLAIGAMAAGASAYSAVQLTCQHNVYCRPPVHQLRL